MSASLVGSEMCIRDSPLAGWAADCFRTQPPNGDARAPEQPSSRAPSPLLTGVRVLSEGPGTPEGRRDRLTRECFGAKAPRTSTSHLGQFSPGLR
eukprot:9240284-Alexandrium_andersonii.AAC.1